MNKRGLDKLRRRAEENLIVNDRKIKGMGKADLAAMAHELAVHQAELEIQNEELLQSRALVEETGDRYQKLFDFAPVGYFTLDEHNRIIEVNLTGCQLLKADKGKLKNKIFTRFIADGETDKFYLHRKKALKTELSQNFILQMKKDDGTLFYAELDIIKDYGEKLRLAVSDISERKKAEDAQRQGEEKYRTLFNSIDEGFCVVEVIFDSKNKPIDYRFLEVNPSFEKQTGLHDAAGKLMRSLAPAHEEHWFRIYGRIALTGKSERFVNEARALNRWYDVYAFRVGTPESRKVAILFNDITARKKSEADLAKARDELEIKILERTAELKETEQRLRQRAEELETVMNVVPAAIWVAHDPACHNITGNQTANRFYEAEEGENVSAGPAAGEPVPERRFFLNGKELTAEELPMQEAAARNVDIEGSEFNVLLPSGKSRTLWGSASPLRNNDGQVRGVVAAFLDITDRTREQEKLKESENRFSKAFHSSPVALSISRINDGTFIDVNQSFLNMYGYKREELIGQKATELNIYDNPVERKEIVRRLDRQGKVLNYEVTARTKAGAEINALTSAEKIEINGQAHIIWTTIDITDRKKAEERLKESEEKFSKIFHSSPIGLVMTHLPEGQWVDANENYLKMLEYTREEVIGRTSNDLNLYPDANKRAEIFRVLREEGKISNFELRVRTKTGKIIETLSSVEIFNLNNEVYSLSTNVDITARKQAEAEINRLNRELKAIWECDQAIVHANNEQTLLNEVCLILHLTANYPMVWIGTVENDENKTVRPIAWSGDEAYLRNVNITWADTARGRGPTGSAGREGKTYFFQDFITAPAAAPWRDAALALGYRSSIALPLAGEDGTVFAVFTLYSSEPNYFNPSEIKLLEMLAGDIAFGINGLREREKRKSAESEILHLASFPELNPNPIIELDFSGNVKYTNNAAKSDLPLIAQGHKRPFLMDLFDAIQKDKTHSVTKDINTGVSWWEQTIVYVPGTNSYLLYGRNITSRKIAEESLRQSEEKFRSMNFTMNEGVCLHEIIYDESGKGVDYKILDINPAYEQITGLTREKAIGKTASELYGTGTPPYFDIYERVATSGKPESFETYFPPMQKYFGNPLL
jgi:PAS domain S-box-containing protein